VQQPGGLSTHFQKRSPLPGVQVVVVVGLPVVVVGPPVLVVGAAVVVDVLVVVGWQGIQRVSQAAPPSMAG